MPGFDGTGPRGQGPMTGGQRGFCAVEVNPDTGRPLTETIPYNRGRGRGFRNCFYMTGRSGWMRAQRGMRFFGGFAPDISKEDEIAVLKNEAILLKNQLESTNARIQDIEKQQKES